MPLFKSKRAAKNKKDVALVFDIGSASVAGALVVLTNSAPRILYSVRKDMTLQDNLDFDRFVTSMFQTFQAVVKAIEKKGIPHLNQNHLAGSKIHTALFTYASPWYSAQTKVLTVQKDKPFTVNRALIDSLVKKEEEQFMETSKGNIIERAITSTLLNGYTVEHIENKTVSQLELTFSSTAISDQVVKGLEDMLQKTMHVQQTMHHSFPLTAFVAVRDIHKQLEHFTILDVSGEVSDLSVVKNGALLETTSFPRGAHFAIRTLAQEHAMPVETARSLLTMYAKNTLDDVSEKVIQTIEDIQYRWATDFQNALRVLKSHLQAPSALFFVTHTYFMTILEKGLQMADPNNTLKAEKMGYAMLKDHVTFVDNKTHDSIIGIGAFFLSKINK